MSVISGVAVPTVAARPRNTQCVDSHCPGSSEAPTFALIALFVVAVLMIVLAVGVGRRARGSQDRALAATTAVLAGVAALCLALFASGFRHYGGRDHTLDRYACQPWWQEAGLPSAAQGVEDDSGDVNCRRVAVDAIGPALGEGGVAGVVIGGLVFGGVMLLRRRARPATQARISYSDHAPGADRSRT
jgi:hypothetical protein